MQIRRAPIVKLDPTLVNQIAAGEVIYRPSSVVKEALENSLDAGAASIEIALEEGGKRLIRIADNGTGIPISELPLAFESHATSKLRTADDLFNIASFGFRGEALPSIASVAQVTLSSRMPEQSFGGRLHVEGGVPGALEECGMPPGTTLEVRNLFFNTPVRRKFLKGDAAELAHCTDIITKLALAQPSLRLRLTHNSRDVLDLPPGQTLLERIGSVFDRPLAESLLEINHVEAGVEIHGYLAPLSDTRPNNRMQFTYLNQRFLRDRVINSALIQAFASTVMPGRYPVVFLFMSMDPSAVDVNVHPTKSEVRFKDSNLVHTLIRHALRTVIATTDHPTLLDTRSFQEMRPGAWSQATPAAQPAWQTPQAPAAAASPAQPNLFAAQQPAPEFDAGGIGAVPVHASDVVVPAGETVSFNQYFNTYIVEETGQGLCLTDQHALHERILYEEIQERLRSGGVEVQGLLIPETVQLPRNEHAMALMEQREALERLGFQIEPFGPRTIVVSSVPKFLKRLNVQELFPALAEDLLQGAGARAVAEARDHLAATMACKAAVKAGDKLTQEEIAALLNRKHKAFLRHSCPHGRPTSLFLSLGDIERLFKRK